MSVLDRKLLRDLVRMWAQVLAIALVMACGVATIVTSVGAYRSLEETRSAFYERYRFASVFAGATRAPLALRERLSSIPGVSAVEPRIVRSIILDMAEMTEPALSAGWPPARRRTWRGGSDRKLCPRPCHAARQQAQRDPERAQA
jgi:putative ABC transport system permease protein